MTDPRIIGITSPPQGVKLGSAQKQIAVLQRTGGGGGGGGSGTVIDATTIDKGKLRLGNYLGGTANDPTVNRVTDITGEQLKAFHGLAGGPSGAQWQLSQGTIASPYAIQLPSLVVQRTQAIPSPSSTTPYGGSADAQWHTAIAGISRGNATDNTMITGLVGAGHQYSTTATGGVDACGVWSIGAHHGIGGGFGGYFEGRIADDATSGIPGVGARARGIEIRTSNYETTPTDSPYVATPTNNNKMNALQMSNIVYNDAGTAAGSDGMTGGTGVLFYRPIPATGTNRYGQFDVGIACAADNIPIKSAFIRDDGSSVNSILINGTHAGGAIKTATGAGDVLLGDNLKVDGRQGIGVANQSPHALTVLSDGATRKGFYWTDFANYFDFNSPYLAQRYTTETLGSSQNKRNFYARIQAKSGGGLGGAYWIAFEANTFDQNEGGNNQVAQYNITSIDGTTKLVTVNTASSVPSGITTHPFAVGQRVLITGTGTAWDDDWLVTTQNSASTFTISTGPAATVGAVGTVQNSPAMFGFTSTCSPIVDRSVFSGSAAFFNDVNCYTAGNRGTGRATDAIYLSASPTVSGSAWVTGYTCDADADFPFHVGSVTVGADNSLNVFGNPAGAAFDCGYTVLASGAHAIRIPNNAGMHAWNAAYGSLLHVIGTNVADQIAISNGGQQVLSSGDFRITKPATSSTAICEAWGTDASAVRTKAVLQGRSAGDIMIGSASAHPVMFVQNTTESFRIDSSQHVIFASGKRIGIGVTPSAALHFVASTATTDGLQFGSDTNPIRFYCQAANTLQLDDANTVLLNASASNTTTALNLQGKTATPTTVGATLQARSAGDVLVGSSTNHPPAFVRNNTESFRLNASGDIQVADGKHFVFGTTTGTKIGTAATQLIGLYGATPVVRAADYTVTTSITTHADLRTFDEDTVTLGLLARVVATMLRDDQVMGLRGGSVT